MSDLKDIECWECKEKFKEFLSFRVHLWFKHTTTYGSTIYPKDLEKCGKVLVDKEEIERLKDGFERLFNYACDKICSDNTDVMKCDDCEYSDLIIEFNLGQIKKLTEVPE